MGTNIIISALQMEYTKVQKSTHTDTLSTKNEYIRNLLAPLEAYAANKAKNAANESLSPQGKQQANRTFATNETAPTLKWMRDKIKDLQAKDRRLNDQFYTVDSGIKDPVERLLMYSYLWPKLDVLDPNERNVRFLHAAEQDKIKVMAAMLENPDGPMVTSEMRERALTERAQRLTPRDWTNYEQNAILLEYLTMMRNWLARWLTLEVGVPIEVIRTTFGDEVADRLTAPQVTGIPVEA